MLRYIALATAVVAVPAQAKNYVYVGMTDSHSTAYFVDKDSIVRGKDGTIAATVYSVHADDDKDDGTASAVLSLEFDCTGNRSRFRHLTGYDAQMKQSYDEVGSGKWRDVHSGSMDEIQQQYVCTRGRGSKYTQSYGSSLAAAFAEGRRRLKAD